MTKKQLTNPFKTKINPDKHEKQQNKTEPSLCSVRKF